MMAGPGIAAAPLRAVPAAAVERTPLVDPTSLPVAPRTAAVVSEPASPDDGAAGAPAAVDDAEIVLRRRTPGLMLGVTGPARLPTLSSAPGSGATRSPDEVRAMLSRFQSSQAAGRDQAESRDV
jgi:hypothetical protein